jgi:hypothetical protein
MSIKDNFPAVRPQLLIDITNSEILDPRVVSSRASVATYYDKFGVLQTANANEPRVGYSPATGALTSPTNSAITSLKGKNWTIKINGVLQ